MAQGTVTRIVPDRGFGFIAADGEQYFFNQSALQGVEFEELTEGSLVLFTPEFDAKGDRPDEGPRAVSIRLDPQELPAEDNEDLPPEKIA
jgi:cold shock CspA family protein